MRKDLALFFFELGLSLTAPDVDDFWPGTIAEEEEVPNADTDPIVVKATRFTSSVILGHFYTAQGYGNTMAG